MVVRDGHLTLKCNTKKGNRRGNSAFGEGAEWEELIVRLIDKEHSLFALQSPSTRKYLSGVSDTYFPTYYEADEIINDWEKIVWELISNTKGNVAILKSSLGTFMVCDGLGGRSEVTLPPPPIIGSNTPPPGFTPSRHHSSVGDSIAKVGIAAVIGALAIPLAGFGAAGVAAGSVAAGVQSAVYGGAATGLFSALQSTGATLAWIPYAAGGTALATAGGIIASDDEGGAEERRRR